MNSVESDAFLLDCYQKTVVYDQDFARMVQCQVNPIQFSVNSIVGKQRILFLMGVFVLSITTKIVLICFLLSRLLIEILCRKESEGVLAIFSSCEDGHEVDVFVDFVGLDFLEFCEGLIHDGITEGVEDFEVVEL